MSKELKDLQIGDKVVIRSGRKDIPDKVSDVSNDYVRAGNQFFSKADGNGGNAWLYTVSNKKYKEIESAHYDRVARDRINQLGIDLGRFNHKELKSIISAIDIAEKRIRKEADIAEAERMKEYHRKQALRIKKIEIDQELGEENDV